MERRDYFLRREAEQLARAERAEPGYWRDAYLSLAKMYGQLARREQMPEKRKRSAGR